MTALKPCKVVFDEFEHTYEYKGKMLSGVTALLSRQLFKDKYDGISKAVLDKAAERGNLIHRQIELGENFGGDNFCEEANAYFKLKAKNGFETVATEWLVSDYEHVASSIDVVFEKGKEIILCDIKATSKLDMEYLSWQLSIYKYLFLLDNPKANISGLVTCWLPRLQYGKPKMVAVPEKPMEWVKELIECDARGEQWVCPEPPMPLENALAVPIEITDYIADFLRTEQLAKEMKEELKKMMEQHGIKKWECDAFMATYTPSGTQTKFDTAAFKAENPELYEKYVKESERKASLRMTLKEHPAL